MDASRSRLVALGSWLRAHPYTVIGWLALAICTYPFLFRTDPEFDDVYLGAARFLRQGLNVYDSRGGYVYPPFMAWAAIPLTYISAVAGRAIWWLINVVALLVVFRGAWKLAGGSRLEGTKPSLWPEQLAAILGGAGGLLYLQNCVAHRQTDVVSAALVIAGCLALQHARDLAAATLFGIAAAMKCTPLLWAPYLLWRGRPWAAVWMAVVALGVNVLPDLTHSAPIGRTWLGEYYVRCLHPLTKPEHVPGVWASDIIYNQSVAGAVNRIFLTQPIIGPKECEIVPRPVAYNPLGLRAVVVIVETLLLGVVLFACGKPWQRLNAGHESPNQATLEYGVVMTLMLLLSPMSSKAHFGLLVLPGFMVALGVFRKGGRWLTLSFAGALLMTLVAAKDPFGTRFYTLCLWAGSVTWHTLFLLTGSLILLITKAASSAALVENETWPRAA